MSPSPWVLEQLAKQKMSEAEARSARRRLMTERTPIGGALRVTDPGDSSNSRRPGALKGLLRPLSLWWHRA